MASTWKLRDSHSNSPIHGVQISPDGGASDHTHAKTYTDFRQSVGTMPGFCEVGQHHLGPWKGNKANMV